MSAEYRSAIEYLEKLKDGYDVGDYLIDIAIESLIKQICIKPTFKHFRYMNDGTGENVMECPSCKIRFNESECSNYCKRCGQAFCMEETN